MSGLVYAAVTNTPLTALATGANVLAGAFLFLSEMAVLLIGFWLSARFLERRPFADYGFHLSRGWWLDLG
ncbi:MAG: hypothetical protein K6T27_07640, partial [Thermoleophilum sp.]|nr:hypothetical protein [Thermoleophilum sp.]